jgi:integrase
MAMQGYAIRRRESGKYQYIIELPKVAGKRQKLTKGGFIRKADAKEAALEAIKQYSLHGFVENTSTESYADYLDRWLSEYCAGHLKTTTCTGYRKHIQTLLKPSLGNYPLNALTAPLLNQFLLKLFKNGYSMNTLINIRALISGSLRYAVEDLHCLSHNPALKLKLPSEDAETDVPTRYSVRRALSFEEWSSIIQRFPKGSSAFIPLLLGYRCGLRLGEAFGLTWDDIDFAQGTLTICRQVQCTRDPKTEKETEWYLTYPKYKSIRTISLDQLTLSVLKEHCEQQCQDEKELGPNYTRYFGSPVPKNRRTSYHSTLQTESDRELCRLRLVNVRSDGSYITPRILQHCSRVIHGELGIKDFNFHSLRHTHATLLLEADINVKEVQQRLGHKTLKETLEIYAHLTHKMTEKSVAVLNQLPLSDSTPKDTL